METETKIDIEKIAKMIFEAKAVEIRDVPEKVTNEEIERLPQEKRPFLYASGNWGPGYVNIKGCVSQTQLFETMIAMLAEKIQTAGVEIDFVAALMTGGVIPGYRLSQLLSVPFVQPVKYTYLEGTRRKETISAKVIDRDKLEKIASTIAADVLGEFPGEEYPFDFVAGVAPSGMVPGFRVAQILREQLEKDIPYVYIREQRKKGGLGELITGVTTNNRRLSQGSSGIVVGGSKDFRRQAMSETGFRLMGDDGYDLRSEDFEIPLNEISAGSRGIAIEELVNFAESIGNATLWLREKGYTVNDAATILSYENPEAIERLKEMGITFHYLFTLAELLKIGKKSQIVQPRLVEEYERFLPNPLGWQAARGLTPIEKGGTL